MKIPTTMWTSTVVAAEAARLMAMDRRLSVPQAVQKAADGFGFAGRTDPNGVLLKAAVTLMEQKERA